MQGKVLGEGICKTKDLRQGVSTLKRYVIQGRRKSKGRAFVK
jgi:hypothetical protein